MALALSLILSMVKGAIALGGIVMVCAIIYYGLIKPILRKYRGKQEIINQQASKPETKLLDKEHELLNRKIKWVEEAMNKGYKRRQIKEALRKSKWQEEEIAEIVAIYNEKKAERRLKNETKERFEGRNQANFPNL